MSETKYYARKTPHSNGAYNGIFDTYQEADDWLTDLVESEPEVEEFEKNKHNFRRVDVGFDVVEGKGKIAGYIQEVPYQPPKFK
jgi:hypothetical protein